MKPNEYEAVNEQGEILSEGHLRVIDALQAHLSEPFIAIWIKNHLGGGTFEHRKIGEWRREV